jgi:hypothetical protein
LAVLGCDPKPPAATAADSTASASKEPPVTPTASPDADPEAGAEPAAEEKTLFVREAYMDCEGEGPMKCLQVRESPDQDWTLMYGRIKGFDYEEGFAYELRVKIMKVDNPPADGSSRRYELVKVVSQEKR